MRNAACSAYLSSWQQRIVDGPYTDGTFKPYIAIMACHYVRWLLNNVYSIVASSKMTNVATMVMKGWQGARSGADWPIAATATGQVFMAQALLFVSLQTAGTWQNTVPSHALNISAHYVLIVYNMTCTTRSTITCKQICCLAQEKTRSIMSAPKHKCEQRTTLSYLHKANDRCHNMYCTMLVKTTQLYYLSNKRRALSLAQKNKNPTYYKHIQYFYML